MRRFTRREPADERVQAVALSFTRCPGAPYCGHLARVVADGVIHLAFKHDAIRAGDSEGAAVADLAAIHALAEPLVGSGKALVGTSGTAMLAGLALDRAGTEDDVMAGGYRIHGTNRWPAGHTLDAARLYRLALENASAGSRLHAVGDQGIQLRRIAEMIGRHLSVPTESIPTEQAEAQFSWLAAFVGVDNPASSDRTQQLLDWKPTHPGLIADLDQGYYFTPD